ncbi:hypothetical protein F751_3656 [Auxenochlorella protothecoides]|uniref:Uncharacterized protein n=1 Tax=Auxenochlorella protothecoides TaxID=3075 RepID=A0A087SJW4_AUXPR|nr:hypothetical protein F751_3656 [Auxenochlorella protothecoides]KFM26018.1 hypothetical protein F751_3656 [Auxenochlorella protothecoides]
MRSRPGPQTWSRGRCERRAGLVGVPPCDVWGTGVRSPAQNTHTKGTVHPCVLQRRSQPHTFQGSAARSECGPAGPSHTHSSAWPSCSPPRCSAGRPAPARRGARSLHHPSMSRAHCGAHRGVL